MITRLPDPPNVPINAPPPPDPRLAPLINKINELVDQVNALTPQVTQP